MSKGIPCNHVRFVNPVPIAKNKEPVHEFYTSSPTNKYVVDSIDLTDVALVVKVGEAVILIPLSNVVYARAIKLEKVK